MLAKPNSNSQKTQTNNFSLCTTLFPFPPSLKHTAEVEGVCIKIILFFSFLNLLLNYQRHSVIWDLPPPPAFVSQGTSVTAVSEPKMPT